MENKPKLKKRLSTFQILILGFAGVVLLGALLLMLPLASANGTATPFNEALFTSTSAVCVTGLVLQDTATYWSVFGQSVILLLIQIGGLGVITIAVSFVMISGKRVSLVQRSTMQEAFAAQEVGGIVRLAGFVLKTALIIELVGALLLMPAFCKDFGAKGVWMSFFHSISAFCNAGFDILGTPDATFKSLTGYISNPLVNIVIMALIIVGGIGFLTWDDIRENKHHIIRYRLQTKLVLTTTALLIVIPAVVFFFLDFADLPIKERIFASIFQSVTTRTAGFNTVDFNIMTGAGRAITIVLMLIGGSPGSTAGGMKTTTLAVLVANVIATFRRKEAPDAFGRRIEGSAVKNAVTILVMYITLFFTGAVTISAVEGLPIGTCLFETASAMGTVGLSLGITPSLSVISQLVLIVLMFLGRVGGLTVIFAAISGVNKNLSKLPQERITVG